jgi:hypothetical protein
MKYYIRRDLNEYGPYTLAELQRYVAQGNIALTDLTRSEGMTDWVPVSQVIGNIPAPAAPAAPVPPAGGTAYGGPAQGTTPYLGGIAPSTSGSSYGGTPVYGGTSGYGGMASAAGTPVPFDFHWALVLLIGIVTCGIFFWVWFLVEAAFVRKIRPQSNGLIFAIAALVCSVAGQIFRFSAVFGPYHFYRWSPFGSLLGLGTLILIEVAAFSMKSDLEQHYNSVEPINLRLNGAMVFFFAVFYFQHHFSRIARWKKTGILEPQG